MRDLSFGSGAVMDNIVPEVEVAETPLNFIDQIRKRFPSLTYITDAGIPVQVGSWARGELEKLKPLTRIEFPSGEVYLVSSENPVDKTVAAAILLADKYTGCNSGWEKDDLEKAIEKSYVKGAN